MINKRKKIWFTSDLHAYHENILKFTDRRSVIGITDEEWENNPSLCVERMNKWLIETWNNSVSEDDTVYVLGDVTLKANPKEQKEFVSQLKGNKILIKGNHDHKSLQNIESYFSWIGDLKEEKFYNKDFDFIDPNEAFIIEMCHFPLLSWDKKIHGTICLMGHSHGNLDEYNISMGDLRVDVGIDGKLSHKCGGLIELEDLYKYFCDIRDSKGCKTFRDYAKNKFAEDNIL